MNVVIRADGSSAIGNGHIWRTLKLANELRNRGHHVFYACKELDSAPFDKIEKEGFVYKKIGRDEDDIECVLRWAQTNSAHWIIVDRYASTKEEYEAYKDLGYKVVALDDICSTEFPVDILVNQQLWAHTFNYKTLDNTVTLFGPEFLMCDEVFFTKQNFYNIHPPIKLFVFLGGADKSDLTYKIVRMICRLNYPCRANVVLSSGYKYEAKLQEAIKKYANKLYHEIKIYKDLPNLFDVAKDSWLAFIAGGMTAFEMCAMGIPMLMFPQHPNQELSAKYFEKYGAAQAIFGLSKSWQEELYAITLDVLNNHDVRLQMHKCGQMLTKECGTKKIIDKMEEVS